MVSRLRLLDAAPTILDLSQIESFPEASVTGGRNRLVIKAPPGKPGVRIAIPKDAVFSRIAYVDVDATIIEGTASFLFVTADMSRPVRGFPGFVPGHAKPIRLLVNDAQDARWLFIGSGANDGPAIIHVNAVKLAAAAPEELPSLGDLKDGVNLSLLSAIAAAVDDPALPLAAPDPIIFDAVPVEHLGRRLAFANAFDARMASRKPLTEWKMEIDDQPIFRYIYREAKPRRHLEFGTWQGAGTVYCLEECEATVWTINLREGEQSREGYPAYDRGSDAGAQIGRLYLNSDLGHRVCQIFSDSRDWDIQNYPNGFFDTVLIDGGHQADVVLNDTVKAIQLLRSGGICLWHDFAPDPAVFYASRATIGVAKGIRLAWSEISAAMRDIFYIWPSQILVGVRR